MSQIALLGASGTIGRAVDAALRGAGHLVVAPGRRDYRNLPDHFAGCTVVISCIASRTGVPADAWAVDYGLNSDALKAAEAAGVQHFVLLSAICVQKPRLAFQRAKLAFEEELRAAPLTHTIVRPTAYFKSLSGQLRRVQAGKPFLVFGDGTLTACKPISDRDLAAFIVGCLGDGAAANATLPIGGPGPAITPRDQAQMLSEVLGRDVPTRSVPPALLTTIATGIGALGILPGATRLAEKSALARIGHYYATESMLVWNGERYDADATPETGTDTLLDHYRALASGAEPDDRGAHAVF